MIDYFHSACSYCIRNADVLYITDHTGDMTIFCYKKQQSLHHFPYSCKDHKRGS